MAELVDAHGSGPCAERCGGSSPLPGTNINEIQKSLNKVSGFFLTKHHGICSNVLLVLKSFKGWILKRLSHKIVSLGTHNTRFGEFTHP